MACLLVGRLASTLFNSLVIRLIDWFNDSLVACIPGWLVSWLVARFVSRLVISMVGWVGG